MLTLTCLKSALLHSRAGRDHEEIILQAHGCRAYSLLLRLLITVCLFYSSELKLSHLHRVHLRSGTTLIHMLKPISWGILSAASLLKCTIFFNTVSKGKALNPKSLVVQKIHQTIFFFCFWAAYYICNWLSFSLAFCSQTLFNLPQTHAGTETVWVQYSHK